MSINGNLLLHNAPYKISSPFGYRIHPITKEHQGHNGVDYATYGKCPPIYCPFDGAEVLKIGTDRYGAKFVYVGFKDLSYVGLAYHCSKINCHVGQKLNKNDIFAYVGTTGRSTGKHLHWSWIVYNNKWNQYYNADYIDFEKYVLPLEEEEMVQRYNKVSELPKSLQKEIQELINSGALKGDTNGNLNITEDMARCLIINKRYADNK